MNRLVSGVRILMVGLPLKGYLPISTSKMLRTGRVLYTSDDVAKAVRLRSFNDKTATSERWGWPLLSNRAVRVQYLLVANLPLLRRLGQRGVQLPLDHFDQRAVIVGLAQVATDAQCAGSLFVLRIFRSREDNDRDLH